MTPPDRLQRILNEIKAIIFAKWCRLLLAWAVVLLIAGVRQHISHNMFNCQMLPAESDPAYSEVLLKRRADGNKGHTHIDFGGQWLFARTLITGHGKELYHRSVHWKIAAEGMPRSSQSPLVQQYGWPGMYPPAPFEVRDCTTDVDYLLGNMMGAERESEHVAPIREAVGLGLLGMTSPNPFVATALQVEAEQRLTPKFVEEFAKPVIGGPLYPPTHPFFYAPIGLMENPQQAYFAFQYASMVACFVCGWLVQVLSRGRIWLPVATAVILLAPGCQPGIDLGQNHVFTLLILLGGWTLASRGYDYAGGAVWGLLAFKPVWGLAFILAPLLLRRWKFVLGTAVAGLAFVAFTIPFVGVQAWRDWLEVGKEASALYNVDSNWISLSRDVSGLTKRLMIDFDIARNKIDPTIPNIVSNTALALVVVSTIGVLLVHNNHKKWYVLLAGWLAVLFGFVASLADPLKPFLSQFGIWEVLFGLSLFVFFTNIILHFFNAKQGPMLGLPAGFLLLGSYLCGYRFMYYDGLLAILGFVVLLSNPRSLLKDTLSRWQSTPDGRELQIGRNSPILTILFVLMLVATVVMWWKPEVTFAIGHWMTPFTKADGTVIQRAKQLTVVGDWNYAIDTWLVLLAWAWCGCRLLFQGEPERSASSAIPMSGERMSDSPTSTA
jgi:arabinofuranan 3-O-arabinosyltransferase